MVDRIMDPQAAARAYGNMANMQADSSSTAGQPKSSFADFLQDSTQQAIDTLKGGEKMAAKAITEEADIVDVVEAVNAAELTLQTVVSIRDRLVAAYQEIMRMPI